jgi:pimeloyl-ACP methyl ester carboxylesterase
MARLNFFRSAHRAAADRPLLVLVPGGPGLSGASWGPVDVLADAFDVATVDPPGTGGLPRAESYTYGGIVAAIADRLAAVDRPVVLAGMSFGAILAAELATAGVADVRGFVGLSAPISPEGLRALGDGSNDRRTDAMRASEAAFLADPSDGTWAAMVAAVAPRYFAEAFVERGRSLLLGDRSEFRQYHQVLGPYVAGAVATDVLRRLETFHGPKLLVAGADDAVVPPAIVRADAARLRCDYVEVADGGHFLLFERPQAVRRLFERWL